MTSPIRVLEVMRPAQGGIRRHVLSLLGGLDPARVTLSLAAPPAFVVEVLHHPNLHATIPLDIAGSLSPARDLLAARQLARVLPQFADLAHAHGLRAAWVCALAQRHRAFPFVFTAHNLPSLSLPSRLATAYVGARCARALAVSPSVADGLAACGIPRSKIVVVPNGIDLDSFAAALQDRAAARQNFRLFENAFVVVSAARLSREKGIDTLLLAATQRGGMTFLIAGDGPEQATLTKSAPANARLLGRLDDIRPLLAAADVCVIPSRREGQGLTALEAMAAGVPLIASRVGGLADMLVDSETALLVPPSDPDALAAALSRLQSDRRLRAKLAEAALPVVHSRYALAPMLDAVTAVYEEVWPPRPNSGEPEVGEEQNP